MHSPYSLSLNMFVRADWAASINYALYGFFCCKQRHESTTNVLLLHLGSKSVTNTLGCLHFFSVLFKRLTCNRQHSTNASPWLSLGCHVPQHQKSHQYLVTQLHLARQGQEEEIFRLITAHCRFVWNERFRYKFTKFSRRQVSKLKKKAVPKFTFTLWWQLSFLGRPGNAGYGVSESLSFKIFPGVVWPRTPVYNWGIRGCQSACFSSNLLQNLVRLNIRFQKNSIPSGYRLGIIIRFVYERKIWTQKTIGDQKSLSIMNLEENSCRNGESLRQKR